MQSTSLECHICQKEIQVQIGHVLVKIKAKMVLTDEREGNLAKRPGKAGKADDIAPKN